MYLAIRGLVKLPDADETCPYGAIAMVEDF
jgi:hypothetical protein